MPGSALLSRRLERPVLTIGNFDGLHVGHRAIMQTVIERARAHSGEVVVYTFDPHPRKVLQPDKAPGLLTTLEQKLELLEQIGVDVAIVEPFTTQFRETTAEEFVQRYIHERIRPLEVYVGYDFHFGRDREGSMRVLTEMGPRLGFAVTIIPEVTVDGRDVNSTRIRDLLGQGSVEEAAQLLGRPFAVRGEVVVGDRRGRGLGFPTANLAPENEVLPAGGVYAGTLVFLGEGEPAAGTRARAVTNVGQRPTFEDARGLVAEAHLLDFDGDVYGRRVELTFEHRIRAERRFPDVDALREQIGRDVEAARALLDAP
ncbi:MAG: bifunctional riboflavin kinase/FAD synthetase [Proteobacteria bacterium]|nr:bifunctional riboflavin kinase/FAD synthetase [Pseudomonadota bacterium]